MKKIKTKLNKLIRKLAEFDPERIKNYLAVFFLMFFLFFVFAINFANGQMNKNAGETKTPVKIISKTEREIMDMVSGYPMERMVPYIAKKDKVVAAFLVGIAKKESDWGKRSPKLGGKDCYNYWGFRQEREKMGSGGHTCFDSPKDAVNTVSDRIDELVNEEKRNSPREMVIWKCGYDCSWDSAYAIQKWITDVDFYFKKLNN